jgi:hypothetical protein
MFCVRLYVLAGEINTRSKPCSPSEACLVSQVDTAAAGASGKLLTASSAAGQKTVQALGDQPRQCFCYRGIL